MAKTSHLKTWNASISWLHRLRFGYTIYLVTKWTAFKTVKNPTLEHPSVHSSFLLDYQGKPKIKRRNLQQTFLRLGGYRLLCLPLTYHNPLHPFCPQMRPVGITKGSRTRTCIVLSPVDVEKPDTWNWKCCCLYFCLFFCFFPLTKKWLKMNKWNVPETVLESGIASLWL